MSELDLIISQYKISLCFSSNLKNYKDYEIELKDINNIVHLKNIYLKLIKKLEYYNLDNVFIKSHTLPLKKKLEYNKLMFNYLTQKKRI